MRTNSMFANNELRGIWDKTTGLSWSNILQFIYREQTKMTKNLQNCLSPDGIQTSTWRKQVRYTATVPTSLMNAENCECPTSIIRWSNTFTNRSALKQLEIPTLCWTFSGNKVHALQYSRLQIGWWRFLFLVSSRYVWTAVLELGSLHSSCISLLWLCTESDLTFKGMSITGPYPKPFE